MIIEEIYARPRTHPRLRYCKDLFLRGKGRLRRRDKGGPLYVNFCLRRSLAQSAYAPR
jgi:hypothetical protein